MAPAMLSVAPAAKSSGSIAPSARVQQQQTGDQDRQAAHDEAPGQGQERQGQVAQQRPSCQQGPQPRYRAPGQGNGAPGPPQRRGAPPPGRSPGRPRIAATMLRRPIHHEAMVTVSPVQSAPRL